jgi:hypothetical protein
MRACKRIATSFTSLSMKPLKPSDWIVGGIGEAIAARVERSPCASDYATSPGLGHPLSVNSAPSRLALFAPLLAALY